LELIKEYPTPTQVLEEAGPEELAEIPYVSKEKAESIVAAARTSMVSQTDEETGLTFYRATSIGSILTFYWASQFWQLSDVVFNIYLRSIARTYDLTLCDHIFLI
jgi:hypothetical protein